VGAWRNGLDSSLTWIHTGTVAKPATNIHIPLRTDEAISLIARVKPDATMPRPGAQATKAKPKRKRGKKRS